MSCTTNDNLFSDAGKLRIWQQNINKSRTGQEDLLESLNANQYDICAIQEPYLDCFSNTKANSKWRVVYPTVHRGQPKATRLVLLVNAQIATSTWRALETKSSDLTAIRLATSMGDIDLYNLYNDAKNDDATSAMADAMQIHKAQEEDRHTIWLGDFNRHHPFWDEEQNVHLFTKTNLECAQIILDLAAECSMEMALPKDIPTLRALSTQNLTRPDNVFISSSLIDALIYCNTEPDWQPVKTDHFPIITKLTMSVMANEGPDRLNYREVDWGEFRKKLKENLHDVPKHKQITSWSIFDVTLQGLNDAIAQTTEAIIPKVKHMPQEKVVEQRPEGHEKGRNEEGKEGTQSALQPGPSRPWGIPDGLQPLCDGNKRGKSPSLE